MQRNVLIALAIFIPVLISGYITFLILNKPKPNTTVTRPSQLPVATPTLPIVIDGLSFPSTNATVEETDAFFVSVQAKAQDATGISLSSCNPTPRIAQIGTDKQFAIKNTDNRERFITINQEHTYTIPARGEITVAANFGQGVGVYGYKCDNSPDTVGVLVVTQE
jgi:hypothetical protein